MAKTIREFLGLDRESKEKNKQEYGNYSLDDVFKKNPTEYCPKCELNKLDRPHTHNVDGYDFKCRNCGFSYTIWLDNNLPEHRR
ncbi:Uncharacterised protein [uncultured archaeon]|nr:Uncharacterised protein [uncultured archaeon]